MRLEGVIANKPQFLRFEAVSGRLLFCRDWQQMAAFVSLVAREYEDEMAQWQRALQLNASILEEKRAHSP